MEDVATHAQTDKARGKRERVDDARQGDAVFTPPELARRWRCAPEAVIALIKNRRLAGFTVSPANCRRPRWRVSLAAVVAFEMARNGSTAPKAPRRGKSSAEIIKFF